MTPFETISFGIRISDSDADDAMAVPGSLALHRGVWANVPTPCYRGTSLMNDTHHHRSLGKGLVKGSTGGGVNYERGTPVGRDWCLDTPRKDATDAWAHL